MFLQRLLNKGQIKRGVGYCLCTLLGNICDARRRKHVSSI